MAEMVNNQELKTANFPNQSTQMHHPLRLRKYDMPWHM